MIQLKNQTKTINNQGFSLIELLVVLTIIAIILTMSIGYYLENLKDSRNAQIRTNAQVLKNAINLYADSHNNYQLCSTPSECSTASICGSGNANNNGCFYSSPFTSAIISYLDPNSLDDPNDSNPTLTYNYDPTNGCKITYTVKGKADLKQGEALDSSNPSCTQDCQISIYCKD